MRRSTLTIALYLCLVFLSGILVGGFGMRLYDARTVSASPDDMRRRYMEETRTRLKLTQEQEEQFKAILESTGDRFHALREKYRPELKAIQDEQTERIRGILNESQRAEYQKMREERERHRPPPPPDKPRRPGC